MTVCLKLDIQPINLICKSTKTAYFCCEIRFKVLLIAQTERKVKNLALLGFKNFLIVIRKLL